MNSHYQFNPETFQPKHFLWDFKSGIGRITLNIPQRKNPLTFESYAELRDTFRALTYERKVKTIIINGAEKNFCSGGDVHDIIGPLTRMSMHELLDFTRMTGDLVKAMRHCPQPIISAIEGICVGAGAIIAMASDLRYGTPDVRIGFVFTRVGLAGCDMGACSILPRIIGQGRAADLLYSGRIINAEDAERWGFLNRISETGQLFQDTQTMAETLTDGPAFAHGITKTMLHQEWNMSIDQAIEAEAQAQAICMQTEDFSKAYHAFINKEKPLFEGR